MRLEMERDDFVKLMYERVDMETLFDVFSNSLSQTEDFVFVENDGDISIIYKEMDSGPKIINWYKLTHVGRCLNLWGFRDINELKEILDLLNKNLKEVELQEEKKMTVREVLENMKDGASILYIKNIEGTNLVLSRNMIPFLQ